MFIIFHAGVGRDLTLPGSLGNEKDLPSVYLGQDALKKIYGDEIGSGYTSDPATIKFLEKNVIKHEDSGIFRKSWETWRVAMEKIGQRKL